MVRATKTRRAYRRRKNFGAWCIILIVLGVFGVSVVGGIQLKQKNYAYKLREEALMEAIAQEERRAEEIEAFESYTTTKKYVEDVAKEKLGLVYEDEIIFKSKD